MQLYNLEFTEEEIRAAAAADRLLSMEIEFSRECNFRCAYCYVEDRIAAAGEMSRQEIKDVILQARELGARKIIILGGEPSIYPYLASDPTCWHSAESGCVVELARKRLA